MRVAGIARLPQVRDGCSPSPGVPPWGLRCLFASCLLALHVSLSLASCSPAFLHRPSQGGRACFLSPAITHTQGGEKREVIKHLVNAGAASPAGAHKAKLVLSTMSTLIGYDIDVVKEVAVKPRARNR